MGTFNKWIWNDHYCHWRKIGDNRNPPIVLIHGFGASSSHWRNNAKNLEEAGFCIYGIDLIGFGRSEQPSRNKRSYLDNLFWAKQVIAFIEQIIQNDLNKKVIIIGNSLGGLVALNIFAIRTDIVEKIITAPLPDPALVSRISLLGLPFWFTILKRFAIRLFFYILPLEIILPIISRTKLIKIGLQSAYYKSISFDRELINIVRKPAQKPTAAQSLRAMCIGMSLRSKISTAPDLIKQIERKASSPKILMIWGQEDKLVPVKIGEKIAKEHPWIKLITIDKCGHCPHDESPKQFNYYVLNWIKRNLKAYKEKE